MTTTEALALCAAIGERLGNERELEAFRMAYAALRDGAPTKMRAIASVSKANHVAIALIPGETETWAAWIHGGPTTSAPTVRECLDAPEEMAKPK